jgi:hypothetical protein
MSEKKSDWEIAGEQKVTARVKQQAEDLFHEQQAQKNRKSGSRSSRGADAAPDRHPVRTGCLTMVVGAALLTLGLFAEQHPPGLISSMGTVILLLGGIGTLFALPGAAWERMTRKRERGGYLEHSERKRRGSERKRRARDDYE